MMFDRFCTLARPVALSGVGLHSGNKIKLTLQPDERAGIRFRRLDLPKQPEIEAKWSNVVATTHATTLRENDGEVSTVEHLLAALWASGLTHVRAELDGPEVPILDGSAREWMEILGEGGRCELEGIRPVLALRQPIWWEEGDAQVLGLPLENEEFRLSVAVNFSVEGANSQVWDGEITPSVFERELASARTFAREEWLEPLRAAGLIRGGSLENAVIFGANGPLVPLRFEDEPARHKALDAIGDLALLFGTARFAGHVVAIRAGHGAHRNWMNRCITGDALQPR
jgi:UDP-3-O-[3-hydroxymyristoyl] N-acetylglucosamine deacetylase